jgi:hypothetical protein
MSQGLLPEPNKLAAAGMLSSAARQHLELCGRSSCCPDLEQPAESCREVLLTPDDGRQGLQQQALSCVAAVLLHGRGGAKV